MNNELIKVAKNLKILYVEDELEVAQTMKDLFDLFFGTVDHACDGQEGFEHFSNNDYDLIVTDINMPIMNGLEMISKVRLLDKNIPILILSAYNESRYFIDAIRLSVNGFILKPMEYGQFLNEIEKILRFHIEQEKSEKNFKLMSEYKDAIDNSTIVSKADLKGQITYVNEAFINLSGYTKEELIGQNHNIVRHPESPKGLFEDMWKTILSKQIWRGRIKNQKKNGDHYWVDVTINPILDADNNIIEFIAIRNDITLQIDYKMNLEEKVKIQIEEIRRKDQMLYQQSRLASMGEMIDAVAHQWKQPLNILNMKIDMLGYDYEDEHVDMDYINNFQKTMMSQLLHMNQTLDEFRGFLRPNKNQQLFSLQSIVDSVKVLLKDELMKHTIQTKVNTNDECFMFGVENEFKHIILNIINNAKDAFIENNIKNRIIQFDFIQNEDASIVKITDNAGGIPQEILEDVFKANFTTKEEGKGTGIGLYMSQQIAAKNNMEISVSNVEDGASFTLLQKRKTQLEL